MTATGYFSLNAFWRLGHGQGLAGLPHALRNSRSARYLNCNFTDIDDHAGQFGFWEIVSRIGQLAEKGLIPTPSIFVRSGRGLWLMWVLVDSGESELPPTAHASRLLLWNAVQAELGRRLSGIGADQGALDVARITRVPGSINSKAEQRVRYLFPSNDGKRGFTYTMEQMAASLGVEPPVLHRSGRSPSVPSQPAVTGHRALAEHGLDDFLRLRTMRGGFSDGSRNNAALIFANILHANGLDQVTIEREVSKLAAECRPPLTVREVANVLRKKGTYRVMRDQLIANRLYVTDAEGAAIPRWSSGRALPAAAQVETEPFERRDLILKLVSGLTRWPPCRQMAETLRAHGVHVSHVTVSKDYRILRSKRSPSLPLIE